MSVYRAYSSKGDIAALAQLSREIMARHDGGAEGETEIAASEFAGIWATMQDAWRPWGGCKALVSIGADGVAKGITFVLPESRVILGIVRTPWYWANDNNKAGIFEMKGVLLRVAPGVYLSEEPPIAKVAKERN